MRVLALGGGGAMGAVAARVATTLPAVTTVVVADRDLAAARRTAARVHADHLPVHAVQVDVTDTTALRELLDDADVVLNTVGPFTRFGSTVLEAAVATGTHYLDICDDPEPTTAMLALDERARAAGITAIVGMGASPGLSNLLASLAAARLDHVQDIYTAWPVDVGGGDGGDDSLTNGDGRPSAAAVHWMEQISGVVPAVTAGTLTHRPPLHPVTLRLPGDRTGTAYVVGHPEPVTLHASFAPSGDSACLMVVTPGTVAFLDGLRSDIDAGHLTHERAAAELGAPSIRRMTRAGLRSRRHPGPGTLPLFFAAATGRRDGRRITVLATLDDAAANGMAEATGIPLALGLAQVMDGTARRPGVLPPEAVIDADRLLADLDRLGGGPGRNRAQVSEIADENPMAEPGRAR
jgi:lysine 6-dehydrogenase